MLTAGAATGEVGNGSYTIHVTDVPIAVSGVTGLTAAQVRTGNDNDGTTKIKLTFTLPGGTTVAVFRASYGNYPTYAGGVTPAVPSYPPGAPWVPVPSITASGQFDEPSTRDFYYYVAFAKNACG